MATAQDLIDHLIATGQLDPAAANGTVKVQVITDTRTVEGTAEVP